MVFAKKTFCFFKSWRYWDFSQFFGFLLDFTDSTDFTCFALSVLLIHFQTWDPDVSIWVSYWKAEEKNKGELCPGLLDGFPLTERLEQDKAVLQYFHQQLQSFKDFSLFKWRFYWHSGECEGLCSLVYMNSFILTSHWHPLFPPFISRTLDSLLHSEILLSLNINIVRKMK